LTKTSGVQETVETGDIEETVETVGTSEVEVADGSEVNTDLLNKLIGKGDGSTDVVEDSENG